MNRRCSFRFRYVIRKIVNKSLPEHTVLKLAVDSENLGLCDSRDYFTQTNKILTFKKDLLIAFLIA